MGNEAKRHCKGLENFTAERREWVVWLDLAIALTLIAVPPSEHLEKKSSVHLPSGLLERWEDPEREDIFSIKLISPTADEIWIERNQPTLSDGQFDLAIGSEEAKRRFYAEKCSALTRIATPSPLNSEQSKFLIDLDCSASYRPQTKNQKIEVFGSAENSEVPCALSFDHFCLWSFPFFKTDLESRKSLVQVSVFSFLEDIQASLTADQIIPVIDPMTVLSYASADNSSFYDRDLHQLSYGGGNFWDGLDGFIVVHEWTHSYIDSLNHGLRGFEAEAVHEAVADWMASDFFQSPCFAPYDANEIKGRLCVRNLDNSFIYPKDLKRSDPHEDSQILSGALWNLRKNISSAHLREFISETLIRLPKRASLPAFWAKLFQVAKRIDPSALPSLAKEGKDRGFF